MARRKRKTVQNDSDSDWYKPPRKDKRRATKVARGTSPNSAYKLRSASQVNPPERYRGDDAPDATQPAFSHELAGSTAEYGISIDDDDNGYNVDSTTLAMEDINLGREAGSHPNKQDNDVTFQQEDGESSAGPTIAHLRRKTPNEDTLGYLYTADPNIVDNTKFHPPSDQYSYHDEHNPDFSLEVDDEATNDEQFELERRKVAYVDWSSLSDGVKFAVIHDLVQDYGFTGATQVLSLSVDEIISFKKLYRAEKAKRDAFAARVADEIHDATKRAPNQSARPFPRDDSSNAPPRPALQLVTDSLGRKEVQTGRRFLKFMGLNKYADTFNKWYGSSKKFHEMPEVLDIDLDFAEESHYRYPGFDINFPSAETEPVLHNENVQRSRSPLTVPPSPGMPDPMAAVHWPPIIDKDVNPDGMELAKRAFRNIRDPLNPSEGPENMHGPQRDWDAPGLGLGLVVFDPEERIRLQTAEELRLKMNPGGVAINGNDEERAFNMDTAGFRLATVEDLAPPLEFANDPNDFVPYDSDAAALYIAEDWPAVAFEKVVESDFLHDFTFDPPVPNSGNAIEQPDGPARGAADAANIAPQAQAASDLMPRSPAPTADHTEHPFQPARSAPA
ncbi:hypothetical protein VMCG_04979 [Cytospora schulzeri]|uniref:Uncharacterized protein n=1 Tax=Cytospora schulzeri TaxID=448051 RepID=A0A423WM17_9PEZI|nr:hypothetical protein VMCG_04979 [Valsa malicola]